MRLVGLQPGRSQRALADQLGVAPTKIVSLVGGLEARDYWNADAAPDRRHQRVPATDDAR
jgi:DNA-binding MarR family transcriptional regulator